MGTTAHRLDAEKIGINETSYKIAFSASTSGSPPAERKRCDIIATITVGVILGAAACVTPSPKSLDKGNDRPVLETLSKNINLRYTTKNLHPHSFAC